MNSWLAYITIFCVGQCLFLILLYLSKAKKNESTFLIILLLFFFSFDAIHDYLVHTKKMYDYLFMVGWGSTFTFLKGPTIYFLTLSILRTNFHLRRIHVLHLLVFMYKLVELVFAEIDHDNIWKMAFLDQYYESITIPGSNSISWSVAWLLHPLLYIFFSLKLVLNHNFEKHQLWIRWFVIIYAVLYMLNLGLFLSSYQVPIIGKLYWAFSSLQFCILIIVIAFVHLNLSIKMGKSRNVSEEERDAAERFLSLLDSHMEENKTYLRKKLSIRELAEELDVPSYQLSIALNDVKGLSFQEYINQHRIEEAKLLIADGFLKNYTVETLAQQTGFNSSATFYRAFKNQSGISPIQYQQQVQTTI